MHQAAHQCRFRHMLDQLVGPWHGNHAILVMLHWHYVQAGETRAPSQPCLPAVTPAIVGGQQAQAPCIATQRQHRVFTA